MMSRVNDLLREAGYKFTTPRQIVADVLESKHHQHLSANDIWEAVQRRDNRIGRMSVYRTLDLFIRLGYVRPVSQSSSDERSGIVYVVMDDGHHHHFICKNCNQVIEFVECDLEELVTHLETKYGCSIDGHLLEFYGICSMCQTEG